MTKYLFFLLFLTGCATMDKIKTWHYYEDCHIRYDYYGSYDTYCPPKDAKKQSNKDCLQCN
ncbi:MAG: hypothetical protein GXO40_05260 [Epsilonproteobacteria bacterium]|nr:hypothetical protein [Campylobacterota bacterium]